MDVRQIPKASGSLPKESVNASLTTLMASVDTGKPVDLSTFGKAVFIPASSFEGQKPGYVFASGDKGIGYYLDKKLSQESREAELEKQRTREKLKERGSDKITSEELLMQAEEAAKTKKAVDARSLKKLTSAFDRKYKENLSQRMKYPDDPEKFMESEIDLDDAVQDLFQVVNVPELYPVLVETGVLSNLLLLLNHENKDIAADVIELLASVTDTTDNEEWIQPFQTLIASLVELDSVTLLVQHLRQRTEASDEEASVVFNILTTLDNMIDVVPDVAQQVSHNKQFVRWLLMRLSRSEFDSVKQTSGEMLVELLQVDAQSVLEMNGLEVIFEAIRHATTKEVDSEDELELIGNLFDALCCCLLLPAAKETFIQNKGVELTMEIIKQRKRLRISCLRVLEFVTTKSPPACDRLLKAFGLKTLFAFFMKKLKVSPKPDVELEQKADEMVLTIISNLMEGLQMGSGLERVAGKFVENEFEKCDRLIEVYFIYHARVIAAEMELRSEKPEELFFLKLDSGLATLQHICLIVCRLWGTADKALRKRLLLLLHQKGHTLQNVKSVVTEMMDMLGERDEQHRRYQQLISLLENQPEEQNEESDKPVKPELVEETAVSEEKRVLTKEELRERIAAKRKRHKANE